MKAWLWGPLLCWLAGAALGWLGAFSSPGADIYREATTFGLVLMISWSMVRMPSLSRQERGMRFFLEFISFATAMFLPICVAAGVLAQRLSGWGLLPVDSDAVLMTPTSYLLLWVLFRRGGGFPLLLLLATPVATLLLGLWSWAVHPGVGLGVTMGMFTLLGAGLGMTGAACQWIRDGKRRTKPGKL